MDTISASGAVSPGATGGIADLRVLIVDDEPHVRGYLGDLLAKLGIASFWEAGTGDAALELFSLHRPDAVLLDINLPFQPGTEVLRRILDLDPDAAVVVVTSDQSTDTIRQASELGAVGYVLKQLPPAKLLATLGEVLEQIDPQPRPDGA